MANGGQTQSTPEPKRVGVVVTHGIGDAEPGEVVRLLTDCLGGRPNVELDPHVEVRLLDDADPLDVSPGQEASIRLPPSVTRARAHKFPVTMRRAKLADGTYLTFAELYWADLTRVGTGRIGAVLSIFRVIFEAHYIIEAMLDERRGSLTAALRFLLLSLSYLMRGPLAGMSAATAVVCAAMLYWPTFWPATPELSAVVPAILALTGLALVSFGLLVWTGRRGDKTWGTTLRWMMFVSALAALALAIALAVTLAFDLSIKTALLQGRGGYFNWPYENLVFFWRGWSWLYLFTVAVAVAARFVNRVAFVATGILALQFVLWTAVVGTALVPVLNRAEQVTSLQPFTRTIKDEAKWLGGQIENFKADPQGAKAACEKSVGERAKLPNGPQEKVTICDRTELARRKVVLDKLVATPGLDAEWIDRFRFAYGFNGLILVIVIAVFGAVFAVRAAVTRLAAKRGRDMRPYMPRVLFNGFATGLVCVLAALLVGVGIIYSQQFERLGTSLPFLPFVPFGDAVFAFVARFTKTIILLAVILGIVLPMIAGRGLAKVLHIARDLIDHQYGPNEGRAIVRNRLEPADPRRYPRRARINSRLVSLLAELRKGHPFDRILFVGHSQGAIIVYDYLQAAAPRMADLDGIKPDALTFGSPLEHIYWRYYSDYEDVRDAVADLKSSLGRWVNLYRPDDYVGTALGAGKSSFIENEALAPGGHTAYWNECRVAEVILDIVQGGSLHRASPSLDAEIAG